MSVGLVIVVCNCSCVVNYYGSGFALWWNGIAGMVNTVDVMNDCRGSGIAWQWNGVVGLVTTVVGMTLQWTGVV